MRKVAIYVISRSTENEWCLEKCVQFYVTSLTLIRIASFYGISTNSAEPDQTPHNAASDHCLHCLLTGWPIKN